MKNHNLQSFNRIIDSEGSSVIGASLFNFLWRVCFNPVQIALAKISYYNIKMKGELKMERMNIFSDVGAKYRETLFDHKVDSSEALFRGNDKTFDEIPGSK